VYQVRSNYLVSGVGSPVPRHFYVREKLTSGRWVIRTETLEPEFWSVRGAEGPFLVCTGNSVFIFPLFLSVSSCELQCKDSHFFLPIRNYFLFLTPSRQLSVYMIFRFFLFWFLHACECICAPDLCDPKPRVWRKSSRVMYTGLWATRPGSGDVNSSLVWLEEQLGFLPDYSQ